MNIELQIDQAIVNAKLALNKSRSKNKWVQVGAHGDLHRVYQLKAELKILPSLTGGPFLDLLAAGGSIRFLGLGLSILGLPADRKRGMVAVLRSHEPGRALVTYPRTESGMRKIISYLIDHVAMRCRTVTPQAEVIESGRKVASRIQIQDKRRRSR
jgi:hypothetical protein